MTHELLKKSVWTSAALALSAAPAFAHPDPAEHGSFAVGLLHPLLGADHLLAMVAVGLWAALLGGRALWLTPLGFVGAMVLGFGAALLGAPLPFVEPVVLASVVVVGLLAATAFNVPPAMAMALAGFFAFFHGHAHGAEAGTAEALPFLLGFTLSTATLHGIGIGMGSAFGRNAGRMAARIAGGAAALGGLWLALAS